MNKPISLVIALTIAIFPLSMTAQDNDAVRPDTPEAQVLFNQLKEALKSNDRNSVASLVEYPMLTTLHGRKTRIRNRTLLLRHFDEIFDAGIRCAILGSSDEDVWGNSHGFTVEYGGTIGTIWFDGFSDSHETNYHYRLMTVNNGPLNKCVSSRK